VQELQNFLTVVTWKIKMFLRPKKSFAKILAAVDDHRKK